MSIADPSAGRRGVIELKVRRLKLEALEKGLLTDFSFLIGSPCKNIVKSASQVKFVSSFFKTLDFYVINVLKHLIFILDIKTVIFGKLSKIPLDQKT